MEYKKSLQIDNTRCVGCRKCEMVCFAGAITIENQYGYINPLLCNNCKMCLNVCHTHAIRENA